jgi:outer membrane protein assembly factor BamB
MPVAQIVATLVLAASAAREDPVDWGRFRGPNGSGVSNARNVPTEFGPTKNLLWKLQLPQGHSSPILQDDRIYVTGFRAGLLVTIAVDRTTGRVLWERAAP